MLGETIGIELELESQEKEVGPFRADILCKNTATEEWVLIENQLSRTDHSHLGQLLTYAAGLNATTIIWIAEKFTDEHRAALDWLNEHTDEKINLFALEIELWRIGDSPIAPKFNIVSQPNDWSRAVRQGTPPNSEHKQLQLDFWTAFKRHLEENRSPIHCPRPQPQHWMNHAIGRTGFHLASVISGWNSETNAWGPEIRAELVIHGANAKQHFVTLEKLKTRVEGEIGFPLVWRNLPENKTLCRIYTRKDGDGADFRNRELWPEQFRWLQTHLEAMRRVFAPIIQGLRPDGA